MSETKNVLQKKYLSGDDLKTLDVGDFKRVEIISNDTINEEEIAKRIISSPFKEELFAATLQLSIAGFARNNYNQYRYKGETKEMKILFNKAGVKFDNDIQSKLDVTVLTPKRLQRIFRYQVKEYLEMNSTVSSFLMNKYNPKTHFRTTCFPNAEHLISNIEEAQSLYKAYQMLDKELKLRSKQHGFHERAKRVFMARGIFFDFEKDYTLE